MKKADLVFVPSPGIGHFVSMTLFAKRLLERDERLSVTILVICLPTDGPAVNTKIQSIVASDTRIKCICIPPLEPASSSKCKEKFTSDFIESHKPQVKHTIMTDLLSDNSVQLAGIVVDLFCSSMIDVAQEFKVPSYLYFTSCAGFLGFMLQLPVRHNQIGAKYGSISDVESIIPTYSNPVPTNVVPTHLFNEDGYTAFLYHGTRFKETKGYIINTFAELEPHATNSMMMAPPPVYAVGPLIDLKVKEKPAGLGSKWEDQIMTWLNDQPPSSVVFLCFGSRGSFDVPQLEQTALALESSGKRFLWSIRRPPPKESLEMPTEYQNIQEALPEGFLERMEKRGMVCGWASQVEVLAHPAIGGFVSHCGWNSILESLWYGVPIATWPLYAEQQINAFELVWELGLAVDLKYDYRLDTGEVVMADVIERAINSLMDNENPVRNRVKEMSEKSKKAVVDGGSSYASLGQLVEDFIGNIEAIDG